MLLRLGLCLLFATLALTLTVHHGHHGKQSFLASSKKSSQPFMVQLNKKERSPQQKKEMISFLQKATNDIKSGSFIQKEMKKLDGKTTLQSVKLPLLNSMNTQYSGRVELGSNHQPFDIIFDTGSTAFFVNSLFCTDNDCATHRQFDPLSSKSLLATDPLMGLEVEYGSGIVDGVLVKEDVYIGNLKVPGYIMFLISQQSGVLASASFDGVAGLSFPEGESDGTQIISLFDAMKDQLPKPYFSLSLGRNDEPGSYLMFGGYDESHMASDLVWHDVIHSNYWMLDLTNIYVGDKPTEFCKNYKCGVVIDSGTSVLAAPTIVINEMQNLLGTMSCDALSTLPDVTFEIGKHKYPLTGAEYVVTMDKDQNTEFYEHSKDIVACSGLFSPMDIQAQDGTVIFILGDTFMSKYYSVFDNDARRIGLALQKR